MQKNNNKNIALTFENLSSKDVEIAGGKGASLGEMTQAGIPVPPGFVILATTFDKFIKEADLVQEIDAIIDDVNHKDINSVEVASEKIQALIKNAEIPESIVQEIKSKFIDLDTEFVAVRSSATAEDGVDNAWAGQLDSFLNTKEANLLEKVQNCWASLFTPRAIFYRFEKGLHTTKISVAVVVQKMVNSEFSGIAFSVHPITEERNQMIIEAGFGLGEAIVSGQINPDSYVVEKEPRRIIDINISSQTRALYRVETGGNEWISIPEPKASSQVLSEAQVLEFANIITKIENHYGFPCDIEWAFENGKFYIVQSRPITTLTTKNIQNIDQTIKELAGKKWHYVHKRPRSVFYQYVLTMGACLHCNKKINFPYEIPMIGIDYDLALGQVEWDNLNLLVQKQIEKNNNFLVDLIKDSYNLNKNIEDFSIKLESLDYSKVSKDKLISFWEEYLAMLYEVGTYVIFPLFAEKYLETKLRDEINKKFSLEETDKAFQILTTPIKSGIIQKEEESLLKIAIKVVKKEVIDNDINEHIREFAWIKNNKFDGSFYSKQETLERIDFLAKNEPEQKLKEYLGKISKSRADFELYRGHFVDNKEMLSIIDTLQEAIYFRSWRTERYYRNAYFLQSFFAETAKRLGLANVNYIFNIKADEIVDGLKGDLKVDSQTIKDRSEGYVLYSNFDQVYIFSGVEAELIKKSVKLNDIEHDSQIKGMVAYAGKVKGPARIILSTKELGRVQTGDVLVTSSTTPDFVPVLKKVVAIVTEEGGVLSHASIISRELHIPCIIGTKIATKVLKDGDMVEVDANIGVVNILK